MKLIPLNNGMSTKVDDEDFDRFSNVKWYAMQHGNNFYARGADYIKEFYDKYKKVKVKKRMLHRKVLDIDNPKILIDHIDGDSLNNQKSNLRICSPKGNMGNRRKNLKGSSQYKGVYLHSRDKIWCAKVAGKYLGQFASEKDAAIAYNEKAKEYFGEFVKLNII